MTRPGLEKALTELRARLDEVRDLDPDQEARLRDAIEQVRSMLDDATDSPTEVVLGSLAEAEREFERSHPTLASTIGTVAEMLSRLGL